MYSTAYIWWACSGHTSFSRDHLEMERFIMFSTLKGLILQYVFVARNVKFRGFGHLTSGLWGVIPWGPLTQLKELL